MVEIKRSYRLNERITVIVRINIGESLAMTVNVLGLEQRMKCNGDLTENKRFAKVSGICSLLKSVHFRMIICMVLDIFRMN